MCKGDGRDFGMDSILTKMKIIFIDKLSRPDSSNAVRGRGVGRGITVQVSSQNELAWPHQVFHLQHILSLCVEMQAWTFSAHSLKSSLLFPSNLDMFLVAFVLVSFSSCGIFAFVSRRVVQQYL